MNMFEKAHEWLQVCQEKHNVKTYEQAKTHRDDRIIIPNTYLHKYEDKEDTYLSLSTYKVL